MGFNIESFVKDVAKSPITKIVDQIVGGLVSGLPTGTKLTANSIATSLMQTGSSYNVTEALAAVKTDNSISGADPNFFAIAGKDMDRAAGSNIAELRRGIETIQTTIQSLNPETSIALNKRKDSFEVTAVI